MASSTHSFDLFEPRNGKVAQTILIVTPYVEKEFFERVTREARPENLVVILDDGCRLEDLETIRSATLQGRSARRPRLVRVLGSAPGLVHLKLFYIVWRASSGPTSRSLVFGSANATRQGFGGSSNAELIVSCHLTKSGHADVIAWCENVIVAAGSGQVTRVSEARDLQLSAGIKLRLPSITIGRQRDRLSNFDLWVQRGRLLTSYRPESTFLKIAIRLKQSLGQTEQSRVAAISGFSVPATTRLNYLYVGGLDDADDDALDDTGEEGSDWRSRLFTWSQLGDWCSEACFETYGLLFRKRGYDERERRLEQLEKLRAPKLRARGREEFLTALDALWFRFGEDARSLLEGHDGIDRAFYTKAYNDRVMRDLEMIEDPEFRGRYLSGYEITEVPRFRNDVKGWRDFVKSLARQICLEDARSRPRSRMLHAIRDAVAGAGAPASTLDDHVKLLRFLRETWVDDGSPSDRAADNSQLIANYHLR